MIVLSFITRNSLTRLADTPITLERVLNSTLQIPYRAIILVDDSEDSTVSVFSRWCDENGKELVISSSRLYKYHRPTRATARQTAIDMFFETFSEEFLMFMDDDCILNDGWRNWIEKNRVLEDPMIGEVWGIVYDVIRVKNEYLKILSKKDIITLHIEGFKYRGGLHNTIYRRKAIDGVRIPPELHVYEDGRLHHYVMCKGYRYVVNPVGVLHYNPFKATSIRKILEKYYLEINLGLRYGIMDIALRKRFEEPILRGFIGLLYPLAVIPLRLYVNTRYRGLKEGIITTLREQFARVFVRYYALKLKLKGLRPPNNICNIIERYCKSKEW